MKYKRKKDKDFWQMARAYLHDFMPAVRNQSDKSVAAYKQSLNSYLTFLESKKGLKEDQVTLMHSAEITSRISLNGCIRRSTLPKR